MLITVTRTCPFCGEQTSIEVDLHEYMAWEDGKLAQYAFKSLEPWEREVIISGICLDCQGTAFDDDDEGTAFDDPDNDEGFDPFMGQYTFDC